MFLIANVIFLTYFNEENFKSLIVLISESDKHHPSLRTNWRSHYVTFFIYSFEHLNWYLKIFWLMTFSVCLKTCIQLEIDCRPSTQAGEGNQLRTLHRKWSTMIKWILKSSINANGVFFTNICIFVTERRRKTNLPFITFQRVCPPPPPKISPTTWAFTAHIPR